MSEQLCLEKSMTFAPNQRRPQRCFCEKKLTMAALDIMLMCCVELKTNTSMFGGHGGGGGGGGGGVFLLTAFSHGHVTSHRCHRSYKSINELVISTKIESQ